jgi:hypothetical protein
MDPHTAAFEGDVATLQRLAELGPIDPGQQDASGRTLLYAACRGERCSPAVVSFLLHECVSPDQSGSARIASTGGSLPQHGAVMAWKDLLAKGPVSADAERIRAILLLLKGSGSDFRALNESGVTALQEFKQLSPHALSATIEQALATSAAPSGRYLASFLLHRSLSHLLVVMYPEEAETHSKARLLSYVNWTGKAALPAAEWFAYTSPFRFSMPSASVFRPHPLTLEHTLRLMFAALNGMAEIGLAHAEALPCDSSAQCSGSLRAQSRHPIGAFRRRRCSTRR